MALRYPPAEHIWIAWQPEPAKGASLRPHVMPFDRKHLPPPSTDKDDELFNCSANRRHCISGYRSSYRPALHSLASSASISLRMFSGISRQPQRAAWARCQATRCASVGFFGIGLALCHSALTLPICVLLTAPACGSCRYRR